MRNSIASEWRYFLLALGFFTRIPVPSVANFQESELNASAKYFPLIGILIGAFGAGSYLLSVAVLPKAIAVLISMSSTIYLTGAFHEDGLADSADGLGGGWSREQILTIMQDSRLGTYGAIALFIALLAKFQLLIALDTKVIPFAIIVGHTVSRLSAVWLMATLQYAKTEGKAKPLATQISLSALVLTNIIGLLIYGAFVIWLSTYSDQSVGQLVLLTTMPVLLSGYWWRYKIKTWLDGYTGDTLGAMQQVTELAFYLGFLLWSVNL